MTIGIYDSQKCALTFLSILTTKNVIVSRVLH